MEIINRAAITVTFLKPFIDWNNKLMPELPMSENRFGESSTYLIPEQFDDAEKVIKKYYKQIFENELFQMWTEENDWPENISVKLFNEWFSVEVSEYVYDLSRSALKRSEISI
jgi:hypothetical protein